VLNLAVHPFTHVVWAPIDSHSAQRPCAAALRVYPPWFKTAHARFGTRPQGHGDGVAPLQYRALSDEAGRVAPQGYGHEVRGAAS
jgi:hypothetical protein